MIQRKERVAILKPEYDGDTITTYLSVGNVWADIESLHARGVSPFLQHFHEEFLVKPLLRIRMHRKISIDNDDRVSFRGQTYALISQALNPTEDYQSYLISPLEEAEE